MKRDLFSFYFVHLDFLFFSINGMLQLAFLEGQEMMVQYNLQNNIMQYVENMVVDFKYDFQEYQTMYDGMENMVFLVCFNYFESSYSDKKIVYYSVVFTYFESSCQSYDKNNR
eukprot:TRINITY_DN423_c0_g1_i2.p5 TRINITY_DN423_c0_g1~~TRINITY_DN423_c0_g1_i2.p5  ORF type:complete len:113 (-),score=5.47 TRINITY_DN423_c0_g1_i2:459-797(-)